MTCCIPRSFFYDFTPRERVTAQLDDNDTCGITLNPFKDLQKVIVIDCNKDFFKNKRTTPHAFDAGAYFETLRSWKKNCPTCRKNITKIYRLERTSDDQFKVLHSEYPLKPIFKRMLEYRMIRILCTAANVLCWGISPLILMSKVVMGAALSAFLMFTSMLFFSTFTLVVLADYFFRHAFTCVLDKFLFLLFSIKVMGEYVYSIKCLPIYTPRQIWEGNILMKIPKRIDEW